MCGRQMTRSLGRRLRGAPKQRLVRVRSSRPLPAYTCAHDIVIRQLMRKGEMAGLQSAVWMLEQDREMGIAEECEETVAAEAHAFA